ncbi:hypothetical protein GLYMA_02G141900v4 [Glycine max]|uniref:Fungal lipase-type domain-containing protein n=3 Tax=Glycine subgen. Soja TaxID=1462606 RepID=I1JF44_SOYBN|nr:phospholipase A1-Igamma1, chloroplastic [Glycine max]XP_028206037.1 phospholipase A1-Igamma1, chloroplastic-like [Glycine soja]XP_028206049.1 phospholipase A1-Igamma1, chloroplastic-like [Glycine soja]KAH1060287.1 hypothetical protein GYH30_003988 [Glycine max]KRH71331.1 hypothetical protein GLYMA_02G141900v4 [Glycine max]RZC24945.1 Phospholipase A1-Igamma1, chloroplastic isoform A [Glycine soja]|eukprot:XP_003518892.1 phospholipase A1-Igamma1, chloroplastic [Glycine max]
MAASFSSMLIIPSSKISYEASLGGLSFHNFLTAKSPPLKRNQKSIKVVTRDNHSPLVDDLMIEVQEHEHEHATLHQKDLSEMWRQIHGEKNWEGLLDPMDPLLRSEVIRYGELAQACYDAFDYEPFSRFCGTCRFEEEKFFSSLGMTHHGYKVTRYIHLTANTDFLLKWLIHSKWPTAWSKVNWGGYVAVSDDATSRRLGRRDIVIAWRGTATHLEWVEDFKTSLTPVSSKGIPCHDDGVKVDNGFLDMYTGKDETSEYCQHSARDHVLREVKRLMDMYSEEEVSITVTGHSLGSALAILSAYDIVEKGLDRGVPVSVMSFSGPAVGNKSFKNRLNRLGVKVLRVINENDWVPWLSPWLPPFSYCHVGEELKLDNNKSPFLKPDNNCAHNLEVLLHLLDGYHGERGEFMLASDRDHALVNKGGDFLKESYLVPPNWWQDENKGLKRSSDGRWVQPERTIEVDGYP